jgi:hypothetical protein
LRAGVEELRSEVKYRLKTANLDGQIRKISWGSV